MGNFKLNENLILCLHEKMVISSNPLKCFVFSFQTNQEFNKIKDIFIQKWSNNLHIRFRNSTSVELFV